MAGLSFHALFALLPEGNTQNEVFGNPFVTIFLSINFEAKGKKVFQQRMNENAACYALFFKDNQFQHAQAS